MQDMIYCATAAETLGNASADDIAAFYNTHGGPLPFGHAFFPGNASLFCHIFLIGFKARGGQLYSTRAGVHSVTFAQ